MIKKQDPTFLNNYYKYFGLFGNNVYLRNRFL